MLNGTRFIRIKQKKSIDVSRFLSQNENASSVMACDGRKGMVKTMNAKQFNGIVNASPEKRYRNFLSTVTDREEIWFAECDGEQVTLDVDGYVNMLVWPQKEFCVFHLGPDDVPTSMEIHDFMESCRELDESVRFMVFPTDANCYVVSTKKLLKDLQAYLDEIE